MSPNNPLRDPRVKTIGDMFLRNAEKYGNETGVVSGNYRLTWDEINSRANRLANGFLEMGLRKGDRVGIINRNNHLWPEVHGGVAKSGGIIVPINFRLAAPELKTLITDCGAQILIVEETYLPGFEKIHSQCPQVKDIICYGESKDGFLKYEKLLSAASDSEPKSQKNIKETDIHALSYTGGTTGIPKGTIWLHERTLDRIYFRPFPFELMHRGRFLIYFSVIPGGVTGALLSAIYGAAHIVIMDFEPLKVLETIENEKIELLPGVPTILQLLIKEGANRSFDLSSLKRIHYGASPIPIPLLKEARAFFKCEFDQSYGMTENTGQAMTVLRSHDHVWEGPPEKLERLKSVGTACRGVDVRIFDEEERELPRGEIGNIVFKSIGLMAGYWNRPEETEKALRGGWFHPGDIGWMDEEGYLFIVDRKNDMIISGGYNVYPSEVEMILSQHEDVLENTVFGISDPIWGEKLVALVRLKEGKKASAKEIQDFCREHLAGYKIPKEIFFVSDPLPRNALGKVLRREVKEKFPVH